MLVEPGWFSPSLVQDTLKSGKGCARWNSLGPILTNGSCELRPMSVGNQSRKNWQRESQPKLSRWNRSIGCTSEFQHLPKPVTDSLFKAQTLKSNITLTFEFRNVFIFNTRIQGGFACSLISLICVCSLHPFHQRGFYHHHPSKSIYNVYSNIFH